MAENDLKIGFVGAGRMATALAGGLVDAGFVSADNVFASDVVSAALDAFVTATGGTACGSNDEVASKSQVIFLAVKPQYMVEVLEGLRSRGGFSDARQGAAMDSRVVVARRRAVDPGAVPTFKSFATRSVFWPDRRSSAIDRGQRYARPLLYPTGAAHRPTQRSVPVLRASWPLLC